jgi:large subunit ribosomal protein L29
MAKTDITGLSEQDLKQRIREEKSALNKTLLNHAISPVENPSRIRESRRNIARMVTELSKRSKANKEAK